MQSDSKSHFINFGKLALLGIGVIGLIVLGIMGVRSYSNDKVASKSTIQIKNEVKVKRSPTASTEVLAENIKKEATVSPSPTTTPKVAKAKKKEYTIAIIGDSMVDTMGERTDYLEHRLKDMYPEVKFNLYNYGAGGENVQNGIDRFEAPFNHMTRHYPSLPDIHPDIIIVGSFAYNPSDPYLRDKHWSGLIKLVDKAKAVTTDVYILAEIAPIDKDFGKGPGGINWPEDRSRDHAKRIIEQLENAVNLGGALGVPVINTYYASKANGNYGSGEYTGDHDGIHASVAGHTFMAKLIAESLKL